MHATILKEISNGYISTKDSDIKRALTEMIRMQCQIFDKENGTCPLTEAQLMGVVDLIITAFVNDHAYVPLKYNLLKDSKALLYLKELINFLLQDTDRKVFLVCPPKHYSGKHYRFMSILIDTNNKRVKILSKAHTDTKYDIQCKNMENDVILPLCLPAQDCKKSKIKKLILCMSKRFDLDVNIFKNSQLLGYGGSLSSECIAKAKYYITLDSHTYEDTISDSIMGTCTPHEVYVRYEYYHKGIKDEITITDMDKVLILMEKCLKYHLSYHDCETDNVKAWKTFMKQITFMQNPQLWV